MEHTSLEYLLNWDIQKTNLAERQSVLLNSGYQCNENHSSFPTAIEEKASDDFSSCTDTDRADEE